MQQEQLITKAKQQLQTSDAILVTASNGFSISEGFNLFAHDQHLFEIAGNLMKKYQYQNLLQAMQYPYFNTANQVDMWTIFARLINKYIINYQITAMMNSLKTLLKDKDYFILTSNVEHHFNLAGFDKNAILETEGTLAQMQCPEHGDHIITNHVYDAIPNVKKLIKADNNNGITPTDLPHCKICGAVMIPHLMLNPSFVKDKDGAKRFSQFIDINLSFPKKMTILELGVGQNHPQFRSLTNGLVTSLPINYIIINHDSIKVPDDVKQPPIELLGNINEILPKLV